MAYWNDPRVRVLKKYGILIDADPDVLNSLPGKLPAANGDMTFHQWKQAVFGEPVDVAIFSLEWPNGNTKMKTMNGWGGEHVKQVLLNQTKVARRRAQDELTALQQELEDLANETPVSKELLDIELDDLSGELQPSVKSFFARELDNVSEDVSVGQLLQKMLRFMNSAAAGFAQSEQVVGKLQKKLDELNRDT
tara:strand:+ start:4182 stop:4760 length:579 start_codon:yes stop_codon:yes gene_type:complete